MNPRPSSQVRFPRSPTPPEEIQDQLAQAVIEGNPVQVVRCNRSRTWYDAKEWLKNLITDHRVKISIKGEHLK